MIQNTGIDETDDGTGSDICNLNGTESRRETTARNSGNSDKKDDSENVGLSMDSETRNIASQRTRSLSVDSTDRSDVSNKNNIPPRHVCRLFEERPRCIICSDDGPGTGSLLETSSSNFCVETNEDRPIVQNESRTNGDSVLALCGYAQASSVLKCGGGVPSSHNPGDPSYSVKRLVGTHVSLCGHAMHSACCESYMKTVSQRDIRAADRPDGGKKGEFKCPLCQRLSNCLVPFIDVGIDWIDSPTDHMRHDENSKDKVSNVVEIDHMN
eukprot:CAMPEP_0197839360 /NCGR_PEP_ID=MMETSP1437-20131217/42314_1 /TAXON_ID=49252 ORGANISM="Eucampia antarctica, Strain CCMP1452" /NCGR_SAMPLE_ID=MMETSP1437 /ASSEMBLY_ACC=CAM_ASM_001096 /LENGTH=268 /DNA_ID=CAMNT_0043448315 /DNA_START=27 /DNA_END=830 /DNA_ORIENTATION=-